MRTLTTKLSRWSFHLSIPNELHMPHLEDLRPNRGTMILNIAIAGRGPKNDFLRRQVTNFVRLCDLSVAEYSRARDHLIHALPGGKDRLRAVLDSVDHLELCIITIRRALGSLSMVSSHPDCATPIATVDAVLSASGGSLRALRNIVMHIEEKIRDGEISHGQSHALLIDPGGRSASIGKATITFEDLAQLLRRLHGAATDLARV